MRMGWNEVRDTHQTWANVSVTLKCVLCNTEKMWRCCLHDHRAIAAACAQTELHVSCQWLQNWRSCCYQFSVGESNIALDAVMLQRFTQHTLQIHTVLYFLCRNRRRIIHNSSRADNWSIISTSNGEKHLSRWLIDFFMSARWLLTPIRNSLRRTWQFRRIHRNTIALLNAKHISCPIQSGTLKIITLGHHQQIQLFDV